MSYTYLYSTQIAIKSQDNYVEIKWEEKTQQKLDGRYVDWMTC